MCSEGFQRCSGRLISNPSRPVKRTKFILLLWAKISNRKQAALSSFPSEKTITRIIKELSATAHTKKLPNHSLCGLTEDQIH